MLLPGNGLKEGGAEEAPEVRSQNCDWMGDASLPHGNGPLEMLWGPPPPAGQTSSPGYRPSHTHPSLSLYPTYPHFYPRAPYPDGLSQRPPHLSRLSFL